MYKRNPLTNTKLRINEAYAGEPLEAKIRRMVNNREPISDSAPINYSERKQGVLPETNIRTDKWEIATDAMGTVAKTYLAKRDEIHNPKKPEKLPEIGKGETPQGEQSA